MTDHSDIATLTLGGITYELPVVVGTEGERAIDITRGQQMCGGPHDDPRRHSGRGRMHGVDRDGVARHDVTMMTRIVPQHR